MRWRAEVQTKSGLILLCAAVACGGDGGKSNCSAGSTDPSCAPKPIPTFAVLVTQAPANVGAIVVQVDGGATRLALTIREDPQYKVRVVRANGAQTSWRGIVLGGVSVARLGTVTTDAEPASNPTASVVEASYNASGNYAPVAPGLISVVVSRIN